MIVYAYVINLTYVCAYEKLLLGNKLYIDVFFCVGRVPRGSEISITEVWLDKGGLGR